MYISITRSRLGRQSEDRHTFTPSSSTVGYLASTFRFPRDPSVGQLFAVRCSRYQTPTKKVSVSDSLRSSLHASFGGRLHNISFHDLNSPRRRCCNCKAYQASSKKKKSRLRFYLVPLYSIFIVANALSALSSPMNEKVI